MKILFVCTGNTCRSPLAEAAWRALPPELRGLAEASSAGIMAQPGASANGHSVVIAQEWGVDLDHHCARVVDDALLEQADLVCTMTADGARLLREYYPVHAAKIQLLGKYAFYDETTLSVGEELCRLAGMLDVDPSELAQGDIDDPYGGSSDDYASAAAQIQRAVHGLALAVLQGEVPR